MINQKYIQTVPPNNAERRLVEIVGVPTVGAVGTVLGLPARLGGLGTITGRITLPVVPVVPVDPVVPVVPVVPTVGAVVPVVVLVVPTRVVVALK